MRESVTTLRRALRTYQKRHHTGPRQLADLVHDGVLKALPVDPVTGSATTWKPTIEEHVTIDDFSTIAPAASSGSGIIVDVHSGAAGVDSAGRRWSDY
jgi:general secretion pathway protein G